jgi:hypothetical protein
VYYLTFLDPNPDPKRAGPRGLPNCKTSELRKSPSTREYVIPDKTPPFLRQDLLYYRHLRYCVNTQTSIACEITSQTNKHRPLIGPNKRTNGHKHVCLFIGHPEVSLCLSRALSLWWEAARYGYRKRSEVVRSTISRFKPHPPVLGRLVAWSSIHMLLGLLTWLGLWTKVLRE